MKLGETTPVKDVLGLPRTSQCELLSTLLSSKHNDPQRTSTTNLNHEPWAVSSYYKNERTIAFTGGKLHYTALTTTNEPVGRFHHNPIHYLFKRRCFLVWERDNAMLFFQLHPNRSENAGPPILLFFNIHASL